MSVTYVEQVPYGYSKNSYPAKSNQPTHRIVSRAPVYDAYSTSYVEHDVGQDQDRKGNLIVILDPGEEVVVHNHYLGHNAEWREITVVGRTYEAKNLFVHSSFIESIARENLPPVTYVNRIESRDYSLSNLIWHTRQKDASYYDSSYAKYFVKVDLQYEIHPEDSLNKNLEKALVRGTRLILEQNEKQVPNDLDVEWCLQYDHFFEVFDFTLEMRSEEYKRLIALVGIDQKYFLPLPQNLAQLPREYSQPSEFEYLTDFYERYPEKRTTPAPDVASNYRRLDLFLDQNNGILNLDRVTENMCAIDPRWCDLANLDFEVRGNKIEFNWSKPILASQVSIEESRIYQNQIEKTINYQSQKLVDDFLSDNEYADKASGFLESTRSALANFNSGTNDLFNAIESLTLALDNAPPIDETTAGALSALSDPSTAADLFQPQVVVDESLQDIVDFYNQNTTYEKIIGSTEDGAISGVTLPSDFFLKYYYLKEFTNLRYIRVLPFNNKKDFIDSKTKLQDIFNELQKLKDDYEGKVYNFDPEEDYKSINGLYKLIEEKFENNQDNDYTWENHPFTVEIHYNSEYKPIFLYIKQVGTFFPDSKAATFGSTLEIVMSRYDLQQKRISYYTLELLDIINKGVPSDIKLWTDEFTRFPNVEYVPRFKNITRKEKQLRRGKRNQFVINNVLKKEEDESLNDLGKLVSGSLAAQEYVANSVDTAIQVTDDLINDINTIDDAFDKYLDKQAVDNPILIATLRCLIPQIDLALLPETDEVEIIREAIQTVELALETYDSLNKGVAMSLKRLGIPTSGDSSGDAYQKAFEELGEKAMNLAYAIAVKKALQIVQALCLQAQKFILDLLLALLNGSDEERPDMNKILRTGDQLFPQPGPGQSPQIGAFQRASTGGSIDSSPDPEELQKFFNDVANILSPIEFCAMFSRQTTPSYILDIAFNFLTTKYENTLLPHIRNRGELAAVIKSLSDFIDRDMCDQLVAQYQIPTEGYSHTKILCEDTNRLRNDLLAESFGIELAEIESIVANQNQSNMSLLRDTMNNLQQPNEQVVDIYAQVRDTPEAKEYFRDSPSPDIENLILQDMVKMHEFIDDTKRLRIKSTFAASEKGLLIPHYANGMFQLEAPGDPWDPDDPSKNYLFLPFTALRLPVEDKYGFDYSIFLDQFQKRKYIEDTYSYYLPTNLIYTVRDITTASSFIDSSNYMNENLFSYLNTSTTNPIKNVDLEVLHNLEQGTQDKDLSELKFYNSETKEEELFYNYTEVKKEKDDLTIWYIAAAIIGGVIGAATSVFTLGSTLALSLGFIGYGIGTIAGLTLLGGALATAIVYVGSSLAREVAELFRRNEDMPPINNVVSVPFYESELGEIIEGQTTIERIFANSDYEDAEKIIDRNIYKEDLFVSSDKRYIFPSINELYNAKQRDFDMSLKIGDQVEILPERFYLLHDRVDSLELLGYSNKTKGSNSSIIPEYSQISSPNDFEDETTYQNINKNRVDISSVEFSSKMDDVVPSFSITLRDSGLGKYYGTDVQDVLKQYTIRLTDKHKAMHVSDSGAISLIDTQTFPSYDEDNNINGSIKKQSATEVQKVSLENINYVSGKICEYIKENLENYLEPSVITGALIANNPEALEVSLRKQIELIVSSLAVSYLSQKISIDVLANTLSDSDKKISEKYRILFEKTSNIFNINTETNNLHTLEKKFSSGYPSIDSGVGDTLSVDERIDTYFNVLYYIKTFVVEYIIKILPCLNTSKITEQFMQQSIREIYKELYKSLEFEEEKAFKYSFLYYVNAYYYFLNQEECIDVNMKDANYALYQLISNSLQEAMAVLSNIEEFKSENEDGGTLLVKEFDIINYDMILDYIYGRSSIDILDSKSLPEKLKDLIEQAKNRLESANDYVIQDLEQEISELEADAERIQRQIEALPESRSSDINNLAIELEDVLERIVQKREDLEREQNTTTSEDYKWSAEHYNRVLMRELLENLGIDIAADNISPGKTNPINGILWNAVRFKVVYEDGEIEYLNYNEIKEVIKPYSKYKIDNIRVPVNMTLSRMKVPFISNKNVGKWKNTQIKLNSEQNGYYFDDVDFVYNENYLKFLKIDKVFVQMTPCISFPCSSNRNFTGYQGRNELVMTQSGEADIYSKLPVSFEIDKTISLKEMRNFSYEDFASTLALTYFKEGGIGYVHDPSKITKSTIIKTSDISYLDGLGYELPEPIYSKDEIFEMQKSKAEKKIEEIVDERSLSSTLKILTEQAEQGSEFYKRMSSLVEANEMSILAPIVSDFVEKYVLNLDIFNFYSSRNLIKRKILKTENIIIDDALPIDKPERAFGEHISTSLGQDVVDNLSESWKNVTADISLRLEKSDGEVITRRTEDIYSVDLDLGYDITRTLLKNIKLDGNSSTDAEEVYIQETNSSNSDFNEYQKENRIIPYHDALPILGCPVLMQPEQVSAYYKHSYGPDPSWIGMFRFKNDNESNLIGITERNKFIINQGDFTIENHKRFTSPRGPGPSSTTESGISLPGFIVNNNNNDYPLFSEKTVIRDTVLDPTFRYSVPSDDPNFNSRTENAPSDPSLQDYTSPTDRLKYEWVFDNGSNSYNILDWYSGYYEDIEITTKEKINLPKPRQVLIDEKFSKVRAPTTLKGQYYKLLSPHIESIIQTDRYTISPTGSKTVNFTQDMLLDHKDNQINVYKGYAGYGIPHPEYGYNIPEDDKDFISSKDTKYLNKGFLRQPALEAIGFREGLHFDGFEEDHEDED